MCVWRGQRKEDKVRYNRETDTKTRSGWMAHRVRGISKHTIYPDKLKMCVVILIPLWERSCKHERRCGDIITQIFEY